MPVAMLCAWFGVPRWKVYYKPTKAALEHALTARFGTLANSIRISF
ncbi:hypothetical protein [Pararhodobacter sp. CCB-MM2]|nr:hypothetical protein [Pararhodobacter sp. CCB-MM2]